MNYHQSEFAARHNTRTPKNAGEIARGEIKIRKNKTRTKGHVYGFAIRRRRLGCIASNYFLVRCLRFLWFSHTTWKKSGYLGTTVYTTSSELFCASLLVQVVRLCVAGTYSVQSSYRSLSHSLAFSFLPSPIHRPHVWLKQYVREDL